MFTGIVEELGTVISLKRGSKAAVLTIKANVIFEDLKLGDSVAVNGVCLTATHISGNTFQAGNKRQTYKQHLNNGNVKKCWILIKNEEGKDKMSDVVCEVIAQLPTKYGTFEAHGYVDQRSGEHHVALVKGDIADGEPVLCRVHSECLTGDTFGSLRCDCGEQRSRAMRQIEKEGRGVFLYMRQEGRGIGLINKLKAYVLQEQGMDTVEANLALGFKDDERDYSAGAMILQDLGIKKLRLMTNNPTKIDGLNEYGLEIVERVPIQMPINPFDKYYMQTKQKKMGHMTTYEV